MMDRIKFKTQLSIIKKAEGLSRIPEEKYSMASLPQRTVKLGQPYFQF